MAYPRADRLKEPPIVGEVYLVPAVRWKFGNGDPEEMWWPVWGRKHDDIEHLDFALLHYHADPRFLTPSHWRLVRAERDWSYDDTTRPLELLQKFPLASMKHPDGPPRPRLREFTCTLNPVPYLHADKERIREINRAFAGRTCARGPRGLVCPHKHFPLGSIAPVDGVITCPLHGLRIDAATGACLGPQPEHPHA